MTPPAWCGEGRHVEASFFRVTFVYVSLPMTTRAVCICMQHIMVIMVVAPDVNIAPRLA